jgi:hypothetical protein
VDGEEGTVADLARRLQIKGQKSVCLAGDLVQNRKCQTTPAPAETVPAETVPAAEETKKT